MSLEEDARRYLSPRVTASWEWSADGEVVRWSEGSTIVFRDELLFLLTRLAPRGLPPFEALIVLLAACRDGWDEEGQPMASELSEATRAGLERVRGLPVALRTRVEAKAELAMSIVERGSATPGLAERVLAYLRSLARGDVDPPGRVAIDGPQPGRRVDTVLARGLSTFDGRAFELRVRTGLSQLPFAAPVAGPLGEGVRRLLEELRSDPHSAGLVRLTQNLMAVTSLPRSLSTPDDVAVGGISDLSNRGPLDRLLVSELAHDDGVLATRIALNEALYLRREAPPRSSPDGRILLIDSGVRLWGVPRVFALAVALAFSATNDPRREVAIWRSHGAEIEPVNLGRRQGLVHHLSRLRADEHPGASLPAFFDRWPTGSEVYGVLITHERTLVDEAFSRQLSEHLASRGAGAVLYVATVNRRGHYALHAVTRLGRRRLHQAQLDLGELMPDPWSGPLLDPEIHPDLPAILRSRTFPLRLPHVVELERSRDVGEEGVLSVTNDGRLMQWEWPGRGGRQLSDGITEGPVHWLGLGPRGTVQLVVGGDGQAAQILRVRLAGGEAEEIRVDLPEPLLGAHWNEAGLLLFGARAIMSLDPESGQVVDRLPLPVGTIHGGGRFYRGNEGWLVAGASPELSLEPLPLPPELEGDDVTHVFDRIGAGPWVLTRDRRVHSTAAEWPLDVETEIAGLHWLGVSHDGARIVLGDEPQAPAERMVLLDLTARRARPIRGPIREALEPRICRLTRSPLLFRGPFKSIRRFPWGLELEAGGEIRWGLRLDESALGFTWDRRPAAGRAPVTARFEPVAGPSRTGYEISRAVLPQGLLVFQDSRGLLHLRHRTSSHDELTLVLAEGPLSGWSMEHGGFGEDFFRALPGVVPWQLIRDGLLRLWSTVP